MKRYQVIIALLVCYALFMTFYFGLDLLKTGQELRFYITLGVETVVLILAFFFLRKRDQQRQDRKNKG